MIRVNLKDLSTYVLESDLVQNEIRKDKDREFITIPNKFEDIALKENLVNIDFSKFEDLEYFFQSCEFFGIRSLTDEIYHKVLDICFIRDDEVYNSNCKSSFIDEKELEEILKMLIKYVNQETVFYFKEKKLIEGFLILLRQYNKIKFAGEFGLLYLYSSNDELTYSTDFAINFPYQWKCSDEPMNIAAERGYYGLIKYQLKYEAMFSDKTIETAITFHNNTILVALLKHKLSSFKDDIKGLEEFKNQGNFIDTAADHDNFSAVKLLHEYGFKFGENTVWYALNNLNIPMLQYCVESEAPIYLNEFEEYEDDDNLDHKIINISSIIYYNYEADPVHTFHKVEQCLEYLCQKGCFIGHEMLLSATEIGNLDYLKLFLEFRKKYPNQFEYKLHDYEMTLEYDESSDDDSEELSSEIPRVYSPWHRLIVPFAIESGHIDIIRYGMENYDVDLSSKEYTGKNDILKIAFYSENEEMIKFIFENLEERMLTKEDISYIFGHCENEKKILEIVFNHELSKLNKYGSNDKVFESLFSDNEFLRSCETAETVKFLIEQVGCTIQDQTDLYELARQTDPETISYALDKVHENQEHVELKVDYSHLMMAATYTDNVDMVKAIYEKYKDFKKIHEHSHEVFTKEVMKYFLRDASIKCLKFAKQCGVKFPSDSFSNLFKGYKMMCPEAYDFKEYDQCTKKYTECYNYLYKIGCWGWWYAFYTKPF